MTLHDALWMLWHILINEVENVNRQRKFLSETVWSGSWSSGYCFSLPHPLPDFMGYWGVAIVFKLYLLNLCILLYYLHVFFRCLVTKWDLYGELYVCLMSSCPVCRYVQTPVPTGDNKCFECSTQLVRLSVVSVYFYFQLNAHSLHVCFSVVPST